ncbi:MULTISPECIES: DUF5689 domain-containing protein [unclassified Myroides]|uniref:DUF5689 domain-containing protein n=1 Tax=unclassified Myroides TaxID=2642485 RepID=UPI003D2F588B
MKKNYTILGNFLFILLFTNCAKNDNFTVPSLTCIDPVRQVNTTIDEVSKRIDDKIRPYPGSKTDALTAIVISSDQGGNFYNKLYVVEEQTQTPAIINLEMAASFTSFPPGTKLLLQLGNLYCTNSYGKLNFGGGIYTASSGKQYIGSIAKNAIVQCIETYCNPVSDFTVYNHLLSLEELKQNTAQHVGQLLTLENVQFDPSQIGKKLYDPLDVDLQGYTLRKVKDAKGNTCYIRTGKMSKDFVDYVITANSGTITGIADVFSTQIQFYPRVLEDLQLDQPPLDGFSSETEGETDTNPGEVEPEEIPVEPGPIVAFPGSDFEQWDHFIASIGKTGLKFATQAIGLGWEQSTGLAFQGSPTKTDYAFIASSVQVPPQATALSFLLKGTASQRSLSINVYNDMGHFIAYNLEDVQKSKTVLPTPHTNQQGNVNQYKGTINTQGEWIKIILPLGDFAYNQSGKGPLLSIRFGGKTATISSDYDLMLDEIRFEIHADTVQVD